MKIRFTENEIIVVDELQNSIIVDRETIKRVFGLVEKTESVEESNPINAQEKILRIIKERAKELKENLPKGMDDSTEVDNFIPESVTRRYDPVGGESTDEKEVRLEKVINQLNEAIFNKVFRGKIKVVPFSELPASLQQRYIKAVKKYSLCDNFKKNSGRACGSVRLTKQWQSYQKELLSKYHEERNVNV